jgi:hypothetical protein
MPFHYTDAVHRVLERIVAESPLFPHVRLAEVAVGFAQARKRSHHGMYAKLVALGGSGAEPCFFRGRQVLYALYVYLPRFHQQGFEDKVLTLFHELFHVGPGFDGELRRMPGPNPYHGHSREAFDEGLRPHVKDFLDGHSSHPHLDFLRTPLDALERAHGGIMGTWIQLPEGP